jgi:predicted Zn-dependent protease
MTDWKRPGARAAARARIACVWLLAWGVLAAGCATNPVTGKHQLSFVSPSKELEMGREADPAIIAEYGLYGDSAMASYVDSIGQRLARVSELPGLKWHFRLLDSPVVNAFAVPGGYIYINRGLLPYMSSEAQLAGVIGHEIGHVTSRHTAQQMTNQELAQVGLILGMVFVSPVRQYGALAQQGLQLLFLKYSRDDETQADALGIEYATSAGYDPRVIPATYATLKRIGERQGDALPTFLETHPDPGDRQLRTMQLADAAGASAHRALEINSAGYQRRIEGIVFGDDPREGFFEDSRFYHPDLAFQLIFPSGWQTQNTPSAVLAASQSEGGAMQVTLGNSRDTTLTPSEYVDSLTIKHEITGASGRAEQFRDCPAWVGMVSAQGQNGRTDMIAGFIRFRPGQFLQVLGQVSSMGSASEQIYSSIRSVAPLRDPTKLNVTPDRVSIQPAKETGSFARVWSAFGPLALGVEDGAILNSTRGTQEIAAGTPIKIVTKGNHPWASP